MKKHMIRFWMTACLVFGLFISPVGKVNIWAAEVIATVQGNVMAGTTADLLKLSTKEGDMEIKIDGGTDTSDCKVLLPGSKINVSVSQGSDAYLHAVKITSGDKAAAVTLDSSSSTTVTGTISEKSKDDILYVKTQQGEMQIKMDASTSLTGCSVIVADRKYNITCVRGSDAYMHATNIAEAQGGESGSGSKSAPASDPSLTPAPESSPGASTTTVTGTVDKKTEAGLLYLSTSDGEMQIVIDRNTDSRNGMFLIPDRKISVSIYRGSDAYMHAASIMAAKESVIPATVDTSSTSTVSGTVSSKSNENMLILKTSGGNMEIKLDALKSVNGCKVIMQGTKLTVTYARGSDAYMHAVSITAN